MSGRTPSGDTVAITTRGRLANLPPQARARITPSETRIECTRAGGSDVVLDGTRSSDPEGNALRYQWFRSPRLSVDPALSALGTGSLARSTIPVGPSSITLIVSDTSGAASRAETQLEVVDTSAPSIGPLPRLTLHAGVGQDTVTTSLVPPHGETSDVCDPRPRLQAFLASEIADAGVIDRVSLDSNAVTLPVGESTLVWQAEDAGGNRTEQVQYVTVLAEESLETEPPPVEACLLPGPPPETPATVDIWVCVVGRINMGAREGTSVWSSCPDDACTEARIQALLATATQPYLPSVQFRLAGWRRTRDPYPSAGPDCIGPTQYGQICIPNAFGAGSEATIMHEECAAAWGFHAPLSQGSSDPCIRGITLTLTGPTQATGISGVARNMGFSACSDPFSAPPNTTGVWALSSDNSTVANPFVNTVAHELGHSLGLPHGDGADNDCNGLWDSSCDPLELNSAPISLMHEVNGPLVLTDLQRERALAFALKSVPNVGVPGQGCEGRQPPTPPVPPEDVPTAPGQPPASGCSCGLVPGHALSTTFAGTVILLFLAWARRRRRES